MNYVQHLKDRLTRELPATWQWSGLPADYSAPVIPLVMAPDYTDYLLPPQASGGIIPPQ